MKKKITSIVVSMLVLTISFLMMGATSEGCGIGIYDITHNTKYFVFTRKSNSNSFNLISLTEEGLKQELLVVPAFVSGKYPVVSFGSRLYGAEPIESDALKKLYLPYTLEYLPHGISEFCFPNMESLVVNNSKKFTNTSFITNQTVRSNEYFLLSDENPYPTNPNGRFIECNFACYFNYDESPNDVFWIDFIEEGSIYAMPEYDPIREGFDFKGWYLETSCETPWDNVMPIYPEELNLYAKWQAKEEI